MSRRANPTLVGAFVVGAALLVVAGVAVIGGGGVLTPTNKFVMYFPGSVAGLQVGAPVNFRGVRIGEVADIRVELDASDSTVRTPVFVEIEPRRITETETPEEPAVRLGTAEATMDSLVERGLRGRLRTVSLVTGQVVVELDFYPGTSIELSGIAQRVPELPTIPSPMEELTNTLAGLPVEEMVASMLTTMQTLEDLLAVPALKETPGQINTTLTELRLLIGNLDRRVGPVTDSLERLPDRADAVLADVQELMRSTDRKVASLAADLERTSQAARTTMEQAQTSLSELEGTGSEIEYQLAVTLKEVTAAARSLRLLAESLERRPESLLRGKGKGG